MFPDLPDVHFAVFVAVGFTASFFDGTSGMGYGAACTSFLLGLGLSPAAASASVHCAETFTSAAAAFSHWKFGNVDEKLFRRLVLPGVLGGMLGVCVLTSVPGERIRPFMATYLALMGFLILRRAWRGISGRGLARAPVVPLGLAGGFLDAVGGGGWGATVTSTLVARGKEPRFAIGTAHAAEFFVTAAQAAAFVTFAGLTFWRVIAGLLIGGVLAAPLAAFLCKRIPERSMTALVGAVVMALSLRTLWQVFW
jgi:hypothetical protein